MTTNKSYVIPSSTAISFLELRLHKDDLKEMLDRLANSNKKYKTKAKFIAVGVMKQSDNSWKLTW